MTRFRAWFRALLIALDQLSYVILAAPKFLIVGGPCPSPVETISSKCGRMAAAGHRWARIAAAIIDFGARCLGSPPGHCQRAIVRADMLTFY